MTKINDSMNIEELTEKAIASVRKDNILGYGADGLVYEVDEKVVIKFYKVMAIVIIAVPAETLRSMSLTLVMNYTNREYRSPNTLECLNRDHHYGEHS